MNLEARPAVLYENGVVDVGCTHGPQQILANHNAGVYTTALITPSGQVVDWHLHRRRLLRGIEIINTRPSRPFQSVFSVLESQGSSLNDLFHRHVVPAVKTALAAFYGEPIPAAEPNSSHSQSQHEAMAASQEAQQSHAMLVVCLSPLPWTDGNTGVCAGGGGGVNGGRDGAGNSAAATVDETVPPISIVVYCKAVHPPPYGPEHAVQAAVMGRPRSLPGAKASSWVVERRQYDERKPAEATEVLLADVDGHILEGLITNFAVIAVAAPDPPAASSPSCEQTVPLPSDVLSPAATGTSMVPVEASTAPAATTTEEVVLRVCGPQLDSALQGVVQARVVEAAQRLGLRVVLEPPLATERDSWREAFISNCLRRIQPLSRVFCPADNAWDSDPWDCWLPYPAGPYTTALLRELQLIEQRIAWREL